MDNNASPTTASTINIQEVTGFHLDTDGVLLHRNVLINQLRDIGYTGSVSVSVPALRAMHAEKLAAHTPTPPVKKPRAKKEAKEIVASTEEQQAKSLKNLERAAVRKVTKELAASAAA